MDGTAIIVIILAIAGVVTLAIYVLKGVLDQLPDLFESARKARDAWNELTTKEDETTQPDETEEQSLPAINPPVDDAEEPPPVVVPSTDDEEPPTAA
ncbi:hypothetical protein [Streptomyces hyaluromycini]|uniref:hypothetical protein n=1 Tax=Streptomyces hyaluromycini TaxID=1377993 RepID=UPI000B5C9A06|nr:hypothetical protein [Streptomyces hyaluromycini]